MGKGDWRRPEMVSKERVSLNFDYALTRNKREETQECGCVYLVGDLYREGTIKLELISECETHRSD